MGGPLRVRQRVIEVNSVMAAREAGDLVHVGVGQLLRPDFGVELAVDVGDLFAGVEVVVDLAGAEEVVNWVVCSCALNGK